MELNILTLLYLFFRLAPFIIVSYFSLASLFNQDMKGLIYLIGLLFACFSTFLIGETGIGFSQITPDNSINDTSGVCNLITIGKTGSFSKLPLGLTILSYTFLYLVYIIVSTNLTVFNIPTLVFFPILILADIFWNISNRCYGTIGIFIALLIGGLCGLVWGVIIQRLNDPSLLFLNVGTNQNICKRPSKQLFKCTFPTHRHTTNDIDQVS